MGPCLLFRDGSEGSGIEQLLICSCQVKEGTERRGALQSVMRIVRKTVSHHPEATIHSV